MIIYFAGTPAWPVWEHFLDKRLIRNVLQSFYYLKNETSIKAFINKTDHLFIDSGAHSASTLGAGISLDRYIAFIKKYNFQMYANLDVVGDAVKTRENLLKMKAADLRPITVFHRTEDYKYLQQMCQEEEYIGLGGMVGDTGSDKLIGFNDLCWKIIYKENPKIKVHGFGVTDKYLVMNYPWTSVDSSSWLSCIRFGRTETDEGEDCHINQIIHEEVKRSGNLELLYDKNKVYIFLLERERKTYLEMQAKANDVHSKTNWKEKLLGQGELFDLLTGEVN